MYTSVTTGGSTLLIFSTVASQWLYVLVKWQRLPVSHHTPLIPGRHEQQQKQCDVAGNTHTQ